MRVCRILTWAGPLERMRSWPEADNGLRSDMHLWHDGRIGPLVVESDYVLGHEAAGVVLLCGESVDCFQPGTPPYSSRLVREKNS
jgi:hypothetical protein